MADLLLRGAYTALVTPFSTDGSIDWSAFDKHVERQVEEGIAGLVPCGTTGESPTLEAAEQKEIIARTVKLVKGRCPVLAGAGSNSTAHTVSLAQSAQSAGADGVMVVMPYYNRPSPEGLLGHVRAVERAVELPVVLYNIPCRTGVDLNVETTLRILEACPRVVGIKDASGNVHYCQDLTRAVGSRCTILSGDDPLTLPLLSVGAMGIISVTSNLYPAAVQRVVDRFLAGDVLEARKRHLALLGVHRSLFCEPSPQPIKGILARKGFMGATVRPPLVEASSACVDRVWAQCQAYEGHP